MNTITHHRKAKFLFFIPLGIGALFLIAWAVMALWNGILPAAIPAIKAISYWQAMGILVLSKIFFGFGGGGGRHRGWGRGMKEKWNTMSEEEKQKFKEEIRRRWGKKTDEGFNAAEEA